MDREHILRIVDELKERPKSFDWGTKVHFLCEFFWAPLSHGQLIDDSFDVRTVSAFASLLQDEDCFALALLVIPELRGDAEDSV